MLVFPSPRKEMSLLNPKIKKAKIPSVLTIPLLQHRGQAAVPVVKPGDRVFAGTKIAEPAGAASVAVHASTSGTVKEIGEFPHPVLGRGTAIVIESDEKDTPDPAVGPRENTDLSFEEFLSAVRDAGITGMAGFGVPAHLRLETLKGKNPQAVILNGVESEPYLTSDYILMMENILEIVEAAKFFKRILRLPKICLAVGEDKLEVLEIVRSKLFSLSEDFLEVVCVPAHYPQGEESLLIRKILPGFRGDLQAGEVLVFNIATALAILEAIKFRKPLYERIVTVTGECLPEPKNLLVKIGTSFNDAIRNCKGFLRKPDRVLMGGPMSGVCVEDWNAPVIKGTQAIVALPPEDTKPRKVLPCIRCGLCLQACPVWINPCLIALAVETGNFDSLKAFHPERCVECGNCSYVCPSMRPMLQRVLEAKGLFPI
ncbi:MAG TPA: RnfABCDGE type electron transport complex subunit C [Candidatus Omnitrophota bacterium]|nr:RnfABCDGE type electron transport complex subunit C [Candidatus Omnitrophota bacterium]